MPNSGFEYKDLKSNMKEILDSISVVISYILKWVKMILDFDNPLDFGFAIAISYWIIRLIKRLFKP